MADANTTGKSADVKSAPPGGPGQAAGQPAVPPELEVAGDGMLAKLRFPLRYANSLPVTAAWLKEQGVVFGVDEKALTNAVAMAAKSTKPWTAEIAHGRPPVEARDGKVQYLFKIQSGEAAAAGDKNIDYRETGKIVPVKENQPLAILHPPVDGAPGTTVTGREVRPKKQHGTPARLSVGANVRQDGNQLMATAAGMVEISGTTIQVLKELTINGDIDYTMGNIRFPGPVTIRGSITPGFIVEADGDILITGDVEDATVRSMGNVTINQGCVGEKKTRVSCQGNIAMGFIENSQVEAGGDITVKSHIMHSQVYADGRLNVASGKGLIVGGAVHAVRGIEARILGSESLVKTHVAITESRQITEQIAQITAQIQQAEQAALKIRLAVGEEKMAAMVSHPDQVDIAHFGRQAPILKKLLDEYLALQGKIEERKQARTGVIQENAGVEKGVIRAAVNVFQGVFIEIAHLGLEITEDLPATTFSADIPEGKIKAERC